MAEKWQNLFNSEYGTEVAKLAKDFNIPMMLATDAKNKDKIISSHFLSGYATTLRIATLPWSIQWQSTVLLYGATVLKPTSLTLPSTTPCEL